MDRSDPISLAERRQPVRYSLHITQYWDGSVEFFLEGVADDPRSKRSVMDTIQRFGGFQEAADALHRLSLERLNTLMGATEGSPELTELSALADAIQTYESKRFAA